jgi:hypothetical protein
MTRKQPLDYDASPITYAEHMARDGSSGPWKHPTKARAPFDWSRLLSGALVIIAAMGFAALAKALGWIVNSGMMW